MTGYLVPEPLRVSPQATVEANAASATLTAANFGKIQTNTGASAGIVLTLPAASAVAGLSSLIQVTVAQTVTLTPISTDKIFLGGSGVAAKYCLIAGVIGNYLMLNSDGTNFQVIGYSGVVTKEA